MENKKKSEFNKVFSAWDILVIAFGAMIGWGWVVSTGDWIQTGGVIGAILGFVIGGIMIFFVGLTYAELTAALPQCGGEHVFSYRAMGPIGSYICTWAIVLGYVSVVCFEACALPTIITYIYPDFLQGYLYTVAGFDIYASWVAVAVIVAIFITYINIKGAKTAAILQDGPDSYYRSSRDPPGGGFSVQRGYVKYGESAFCRRYYRDYGTERIRSGSSDAFLLHRL